MNSTLLGHTQMRNSGVMVKECAPWSRHEVAPFSLTREEGRGEDDVPHPALAVNLRVETARDVAGHAAGQSVQDNSCRVDGAMAMHVKHSQQRHDNDPCGNEETRC